MGIGEEKPKTDSQETGVGHPKEKSKGFTTEDTENNGGSGELGGEEGSKGSKGSKGTESREIHRKKRDGRHYLAAKTSLGMTVLALFLCLKTSDGA